MKNVTRILLEFKKLAKIKNLAKNPLSGGIPAIEKKINRKEMDHKEFFFDNCSKLDKNKVVLKIFFKLCIFV